MLGTVCADRAEEQTGESAVTAAAHDEHGRPSALVQEDLGRQTLSKHQP